MNHLEHNGQLLLFTCSHHCHCPPSMGKMKSLNGLSIQNKNGPGQLARSRALRNPFAMLHLCEDQGMGGLSFEVSGFEASPCRRAVRAHSSSWSSEWRVLKTSQDRRGFGDADQGGGEGGGKIL